MASSYDFIGNVNADKESWKLLCRVIRIWSIPSFRDVNIPYALEIVLMDEKGDKIQASIQHAVLSRFKDVFQEGKVYAISNVGVGTNSGTYRNTKHNYKLIFEKYTTIRNMSTPTMIPTNGYSFISYSQLNSPDFDRKYLIDVMGLLCGVGVERLFEKDGKKTKYNVIQLDMDGFRIKCALFENYVNELETFLRGGEKPNTVVVLQYVSVRKFKGKTALQNSMYSTKFLFNPDIPEVAEYISTLSLDSGVCNQSLSQLMDNEVSIEEDFLYQTPAMTVEQLKDCHEDSVCVVFAKIDHVVDTQDWWYNACRCSKSAEFVSKMFFCDDCNRFFLREEKEYRSSDSTCKSDEDTEFEADWFTTEFLNDIKCSGMPNHKLILKVGVPVMLLRNMDQSQGLCNGTRLIVNELGNNVIGATVVTGRGIGQKIYIPRMDLIPTDSGLPFKFQRRQFPLTVCFGMTINKSQGQSLSYVGLYLPTPVFTHGQLYVAVSRVTSKKGLKILILDDEGHATTKTRNVVYNDVFKNL